MESEITDYISHTLVSKVELLPLQHDTPLLEYQLLDSLSVLKLVLFLEEAYGINVEELDVVPTNFETIDAICSFVRLKQEQAQSVART
jgi:acyl carrier protein